MARQPDRVRFALIALWGPIGLGVLTGVVIAIAATLIYLLLQTMYPHDAMLGRIPGRDGFYKLHRAPDARPVPGFGACMIQDSLLFYNADYVRARLTAIADELPPLRIGWSSMPVRSRRSTAPQPRCSGISPRN